MIWWHVLCIDSFARKWYQQCDKMMIKWTETRDYMANVLYVMDVLPAGKGKQDKNVHIIFLLKPFNISPPWKIAWRICILKIPFNNLITTKGTSNFRWLLSILINFKHIFLFSNTLNLPKKIRSASVFFVWCSELSAILKIVSS